MSIIGNASLNRVVKTLTNFDVYFNISAESTSNLVQYEIFLDDVSQGITSITPIKQTGLITVNTFVSNIGYHTFGVLFTNSAGESEYFTETIYLDHTTPVVHDYSFSHMSRNSADDFIIHFNVDLEDETGISRITLKNISNYESIDYKIPSGTNKYKSTVSITLPFVYKNSLKDIVLEYEDYSGNIGTITPIKVRLNAEPPEVVRAYISKVEKTDTHYDIYVSTVIRQLSYQRLLSYSLTLNNMTPDWKSVYVSGTNVTFTEVLSVPLSEPEGSKTIYVYVRDNYGNYNLPYSFTFKLDSTDPQGTVLLNYAEKVGLNYFANVIFEATDSGNVLGYGYQLDGYNSLTWRYTSTPNQFFKETDVINLGESGEHTLYARFVDYSGNLSPLYELPLSIDTIAPDCDFEFIESNLDYNNDYAAKFHLLAKDNEKIQFIKLFGYNANTGNIVSGQSNTWILIPETVNLDEMREITIPKTEDDGVLIFHFQAKDVYGNESPVRTANVEFDKNKPIINQFEFYDTEKAANYRRIFMSTNVTDNKGVSAYKKTFGDINTTDWIAIETTKNFNENVYLDVPNTELGVLKQFKFQAKDVFGNVSNTVSFPIQVDEFGPTGNVEFSSATIDSKNYILNFKIDATDTGVSNVQFYSIGVNDSITRNWKKFSNSAPTISEVVSFEFPRTNQGEHDFYIRLADTYKNESPVYPLKYDLDSISIVGGLELKSIEKTPNTYYANIELYAIDNRGVDAYTFNGGPYLKIDPPVNVFSKYLNLPIGLSAGSRAFRVQYRDSFLNNSDLYYLTFDVDNTAPTANLFATGSTSNTTHFDISFLFEMHDDYELDKYKLWYAPNGEPTDWNEIPRGRTFHSTNTVFSVPRTDLSPKFEWRVLDFFQNENSANQINRVISTPPNPVALSVTGVNYTLASTSTTVSYNVTAAANTTIDKLNVVVNRTSAFVKLDEFVLDIPNSSHAIGTFNYTFAKNKTYAKFDVYPISNYGYPGPTTSVTRVFDDVLPTANVTFVGAFEDNYDYILQFRIIGSDFDSSLNYISIQITTYDFPRTYTFPVQFQNTVDEIYNVRIDQTHVTNYATAIIRLYDIMGNSSTPITLSDIYLDRFRPAITNVKLNNNKTYHSANVGSNQFVIPVEFDASDFSFITHYKYSKQANIIFDNTWTAVSGDFRDISINETVDLQLLAFEQGWQTFFIHAKDKFNNIGTAGINFELDTIPPTIDVKFANRIDREIILGTDYFKIPYNLTYSDSYSEIYYKYENHAYKGNTYLSSATYPYGLKKSDSLEEYYYLPVADYKDTDISIRVADRFNNISETITFSVFLEDNPPVVNNGIINKGAKYTNNKDVYIEVDMSDDEGVMDMLFSNTSTVTWDDPNWIRIPFAPRKTLLNTFTVDLANIGFTEGVCNVYMHVKDFCQNIGSYSNTIMFDETAPLITDFYVNNITRNVNTFEIETILKSYDNLSGLDEYYISQSKLNTSFKKYAGSPIVGSTPTEVKKTEYITFRDGGWKKIYAQVKDIAGNISDQANTEVYIDNQLPVAVLFNSTNINSKYYLKSANNEFEYIVNDDYAISDINYRINNLVENNLNSFVLNDLVRFDAQTFNADFSTLLDGEHTIRLIINDFYENQTIVPYKFYIDNTPPVINKFDVKLVKPSFNNLPLNYDVELEIDAIDNVGISRYELYDNGNHVTTINVNDSTLIETPTIVSEISNTVNTENHTFELKVYDYATNLATATVSKELHDGTNTTINNFTINGGTSYATGVVGNELFEADLTSNVNITQFALTIQPNIDYYDAFWNDFAIPSNSIALANTQPLSNFSINTLTGEEKIYLHIKDDCGNISNSHVDVFFSDSSPTISNVSSPINLIRQGKYYVGEIQFQINDPDSLMEAYAVGLNANPTNFKSIVKTGSSTIKHQVKIPENDIDGSKILYLQLRDEEGNLSNNYRISLRILDYKFDKFDIEMNNYALSTENVRVYFETETDPLSIEYGYQYDNNIEPVGWYTVPVLNRNDVGTYYFDFTINVSSIPSGAHTLYVWLKNKQNEKIYKTFEFVSENLPSSPTAVLSIFKTEVIQNKKTVWVQAEVKDLGVGVKSISLTENLDPDVFENINTIQTKKIIKKFEYDLTNNSTITYKCKLIDAVNIASIAFNTSVDLSYVY